LAIGRYDFGSAGSKLAFFGSVVMYADLNDVGTEPVCRLRLCSSTRNGARTSTFSFSRRVGRGSSADCLSLQVVHGRHGRLTV